MNLYIVISFILVMIDKVLLGFVLAAVLGALVGMQRESKLQRSKKTDFAGFRAFTFLSLFGFLLGYLSIDVFENLNLLYIGFVGILGLIVASYIMSAPKIKKIESVSSQISAILTFVVGLFVSLGQYYLAIALAISITTILVFGEALHRFAGSLQEQEIFATLKFGIIAFVILPILPNKNYTLLDLPGIGYLFSNQDLISKELLIQLDVFNFYHIWLMVVFISAIGYSGYILMKTVGARKGVIITGFLAGFMSSTAVTTSFAIDSKTINKLTSPLVIGTVIASSTMFIRIIFEVAIINPALLPSLTLLLLLMGVVGYLSAGYIYLKKQDYTYKEVKVDSPFSLGPALKFGFFFMAILVFSKLFSILFGEKGIYLLAFLSGVADVDAITITLLNLAKTENISIFTAQFGILLAALANTLFKGGIAYYLGSKNFFRGVAWCFSAIIVSGILLMFFL